MNELTPQLHMSPRGREKLEFLETLLSTTKGRIAIALTVSGLVLGGGFVLREKLKSTEPVSQIPRAESTPQLPNN
jgi:hypothetical protein